MWWEGSIAVWMWEGGGGGGSDWDRVGWDWDGVGKMEILIAVRCLRTGGMVGMGWVLDMG
jgi:hypothetical protein